MSTYPPFTVTLLGWYARHGRTLPWRGTRDPYAIWLSEIILQQTRVSQGLAYWQRFMHRFPRVEDLAAASEDEVLRLWQGLGYYSRARNLLAAAREVAAAGAFPDTFDGLRRLRGVGDYTAAAVASIAFGRAVAVVDGNVYRVLARYYDISEPIDTAAGKHTFAALAADLLPPGEAAAFNQAMMDFGAVQCVPRSPDCPACPLAESCAARRAGTVGERPVKRRTAKVRTRYMAYVYIRHAGTVALRRRGAGDIWQGLWEPFDASAPDGASPQSAGEVARLAGVPEKSSAPVLVARGVRHVLTHRVIMADFYLWEPSERPPLPAEYVWVEEEAVEHYGVSRLVEMLLECVRKAE